MTTIGITGLESDGLSAMLWLSIIWLLWLVTMASNYRLLRFGPQAERFSLSARTINRPGFLLRAGFHVLLNWSVLGTTLIVAAVQLSAAQRSMVASVCVVAAIIVWIAFNLQHRRLNRRRNLIVSSTFASVLILAALIVAVD